MASLQELATTLKIGLVSALGEGAALA